MVEETISIRLTKGKFALVTASDADWLRERKWCVTNCTRYRGKTKIEKWYASRGEKKKGEKYKRTYMHRAIMERMLLDEGKTLQEVQEMMQGMLVDHGDGDGLNNTRENLWLVTASENALIGLQCAHDANNSDSNGEPFDF